jgi:hypothetical protein
MDLPTPEIQKAICAYIRQGCFPEVAAEAAGVPQEVFRRWLAQAKEADANVPLRAFAAEVRQATAQARVLAETATVKKNPLAWLKHGPGRERGDMPGWTQPVRAPAARDHAAADALAREELAQLCAELLQLLAPFPEARAAVAQALQEAGSSAAHEPEE